MKKIISIVLVLAFCLSLAACGGNSNGGASVGSGDGGKVEFTAKEIKGNPTTLGVFYRNITGADIESKSAEEKEADRKADEMLKKIEEMPDNIQAMMQTMV